MQRTNGGQTHSSVFNLGSSESLDAVLAAVDVEDIWGVGDILRVKNTKNKMRIAFGLFFDQRLSGNKIVYD